jgi:hypothetical protein
MYNSNHKSMATKTSTGNIKDATNIMDSSNSKEAIAGTPVKAVGPQQ